MQVILLIGSILSVSCLTWNEPELEKWRKKAESMFYMAYSNYLEHAYPKDELKPISGTGHNTYGGVRLSLVDALDTLAVLGNASEFRRIAKEVESTLSFDADINVSVFETNIRIVGGLISAHLLYKRMGMHPLPQGWPCAGPLLDKALDIGNILLSAFNTPTGLPYGTVNLRSRRVPPKETPVTCTACAGTYLVEFITLSRLSGDTRFEEAAKRAVNALWRSRSSIDLVGNHINISSGVYVYTDSTIGMGIDSYFEYLVKGAAMTGSSQYREMFDQYLSAINKHLRKDDWHIWATYSKGHATLPYFNSLEAFWPGLLALHGDLESAKRSFYNYFSIWKQYGFIPEFYNIELQKAVDSRAGYPLRPELVESAVYLYQATSDPFYLDAGAQMLHSLLHSAVVTNGFAHISRITDHAVEDRMESFFLQKLPSFYVFNTEAHVVDVSALYCCSESPQKYTFNNFNSKEHFRKVFQSTPITYPSQYHIFYHNNTCQCTLHSEPVLGQDDVLSFDIEKNSCGSLEYFSSYLVGGNFVID